VREYDANGGLHPLVCFKRGGGQQIHRGTGKARCSRKGQLRKDIPLIRGEINEKRVRLLIYWKSRIVLSKKARSQGGEKPLNHQGGLDFSKDQGLLKITIENRFELQKLQGDRVVLNRIRHSLTYFKRTERVERPGAWGRYHWVKNESLE